KIQGESSTWSLITPPHLRVGSLEDCPPSSGRSPEGSFGDCGDGTDWRRLDQMLASRSFVSWNHFSHHLPLLQLHHETLSDLVVTKVSGPWNSLNQLSSAPARPPATAITKPALKQTQESPATLATTNKAPEKPKEPCQPLATPSATEKAPEKPKKTRFAPLRPSPSPQPPKITFGPPTKRKPPPQRPPSMPTSEDLKKVNFTPVFYLLMNYLSRDVCRKRCDAINQWPHFPVGDFKHVGWRLSLGYFEDDKNTLWRALSFWRYGKQDSFAAVKGQFDHTGQAGNVIMMYTLELKEPEWRGHR
ncbi:hypothetical protein PCASD_25826, partial [Puccinia coronata f. sp. avenae]